MPIEDSPIPTKPAHFCYPLISCAAGNGAVQCHISLGWELTIRKNMALLNIVCPQPFEGCSELHTKAARVVRTVTELWLKQSSEPLVAHVHHPGNSSHWCVGDVWRRESGDTLAQLLWHNDMACLHPLEPAVWLPLRLEQVIAGGCNLLNVDPGELVKE